MGFRYNQGSHKTNHPQEIKTRSETSVFDITQRWSHSKKPSGAIGVKGDDYLFLLTISLYQRMKGIKPIHIIFLKTHSVHKCSTHSKKLSKQKHKLGTRRDRVLKSKRCVDCLLDRGWSFGFVFFFGLHCYSTQFVVRY